MFSCDTIPFMMRSSRTKSIWMVLCFLIPLWGCGVTWGPARIYSDDPNRAQEQRAEDELAKAHAEAFIVDHPELDAETKKELRNGTLTPAGALDRIKVLKTQKDRKP